MYSVKYDYVDTWLFKINTDKLKTMCLTNDAIASYIADKTNIEHVWRKLFEKHDFYPVRMPCPPVINRDAICSLGSAYKYGNLNVRNILLFFGFYTFPKKRFCGTLLNKMLLAERIMRGVRFFMGTKHREKYRNAILSSGLEYGFRFQLIKLYYKLFT